MTISAEVSPKLIRSVAKIANRKRGNSKDGLVEMVELARLILSSERLHLRQMEVRAQRKLAALKDAEAQTKPLDIVPEKPIRQRKPRKSRAKA